MPDIYVATLFIDEKSRILLAKRKADAHPFPGAWVLPSGEMGEVETAEEALERIARTELRVKITAFEFAETLYLDIGAGQRIESVFIVAAWEGKLGYRANGDYEEVRWVQIEDVAGFNAIEGERRWLVDSFLQRETNQPVEVDMPAAWDTIAAAYQDEHTISTDVPHYGPRCPDEDDLRLVGDVAGKSVLELCCGGGQNAIAFAKRGATAIGIDQSEEQVRFARDLAERERVRVEYLVGNVEALPQIKDATQHVVFSAYGLGYVEHIDRCLAETYRVLQPGGILVFSWDHPFSQTVSWERPWTVERSYWDEASEWDWEFPERKLKVRMRGYHRTVSEWFHQLCRAGFEVEAILEPEPVEQMGDTTWDESYPLDRLRMIPATIIFKAIKPIRA